MRITRMTSRGVTLTELLVVMLIIGLLSTVAIPVYINRMEDARVRLAMAETREIAQAEEQVALIHGFYVPFQLLDDTPAIPGQSSSQRDDITQEPSAIALVNATVSPVSQLGNQAQLGHATFNPRVRNMVDNWSGPFLNPQRVYLGTDPRGPGHPDYPNSTYFRLDFPMDPWGEPYRFYSPLGIIGTSGYSISKPYSLSTSDGYLTTNDDRNYERYAVVSWGRDNLPDYGSLAPASLDRNDIVHFFGAPGVESTFALNQ